MPAFYPAQFAFNAGELSGAARGRMDLDLYKKGVALAEHWMPRAQGSLLMRAGSEHVRALAGDNRTRLMQFRMVNGQDYLLELFDHVARFYTIDGAEANITILGDMEMIENGDFANTTGLYSATGWTTGHFVGPEPPNIGTKGVRFVDNKASTYNGPGPGVDPDIWFQQQVTLLNDCHLVLHFDVVAPDGSGGPGGTISVRVGTTPGAGDVYSIDLPGALGHSDLPIVIAPAGVLYIRFVNNDVGSWGIDNVSCTATSLGPATSLVTPWSADEIANVRVTADTGMDRAIFTHPAHVPYFLKFNGGTNWDFRAIVFLGQPAEWGTVWPSICEFSKGRAWWSGLATAKNRVWGSVVGDPFNITLGSNPGDALDEKVATNGAFQWLRDSSSLVGGTDLGEHTITGSMGVPLNGDINTRRESSYGSSNIAPVDAGELILYTSPDRLRIRGINFDFQTAKWKSNDLLFVAEHFTVGPPRDPIKELHFTLTPDGQVIAVLESGKLALCSLNTEQNINAWWRAPLSSGLVRSAAVSRGPTGAYLWMAVERAGLMYLERLPLSENAPSLNYLDASVSAAPATAGAAIPVPHLANGTVVRVLVDGDLYEDAVVAGGAVACPADGAEVVVGLAYRARAKTLPPEGGNPAGTSLGFKMHNVSFVARVNNSAAPLVNGTRLLPDPGDTTPADAPEVLRTSDLFADNLDVDDGSVLIEQDLPYRTEVCAIGGKRQLNKV